MDERRLPVSSDSSVRQDAGAATFGASERPAILLQVSGLTKRYGGQTALADISFDVNAGEVLGLIGPNGTGKTTLLEAVAGLLPADAGEIISRGEPLRLARR